MHGCGIAWSEALALKNGVFACVLCMCALRASYRFDMYNKCQASELSL